MSNTFKIRTADDIISAVNEYGILRFLASDGKSAWGFSGVDFDKFWVMREEAVNSEKIAYGKFVQKRATFVSLDVLPYLCALRRDGYDFDSLSDEGRAPSRECTVMNSVGTNRVPSYALGKSLSIKGYDAVITSLQYKTYLCLQFKKSYMGTALLCRPEDVFGSELVRSSYSLTPKECIEKIKKLAPGLNEFTEEEQTRILSPAI